MSSVLGLPRIKNNSHKVVACRLQQGFIPKAGQAVSAISTPNYLHNTVIPFNGDFYGIVTELRKDKGLVSVICDGLSIAVKKDNNASIDPQDKTYFELNAGVLTGAGGAGVDGRIDKLSEGVYEPETGVELNNYFGALVSLVGVSELSKQSMLNDFNQSDFLAGDFA